MTPHYTAKKDARHNEIRDSLRKLGFRVWETYRCGGGFGDLVVSGHRRIQGVTTYDGPTEEEEPRVLIVEIKRDRMDFTKAEIKFKEYWDQFTYLATTNVENVLRWYGWNV